jgi:hypothetical protein
MINAVTQSLRQPLNVQDFKLYYLCSYMSSGYFNWFLPLFLLSQLLDIVRLSFGTKDMASYNLFVLRRPGPHFEIKWSWHASN